MPDYREHNGIAFDKLMKAERDLAEARRFNRDHRLPDNWGIQAVEQNVRRQQHAWHTLQGKISSDTFTSASHFDAMRIGRADLAVSNTVNNGRGLRAGHTETTSLTNYGAYAQTGRQLTDDNRRHPDHYHQERFTYGKDFQPFSNSGGGMTSQNPYVRARLARDLGGEGMMALAQRETGTYRVNSGPSQGFTPTRMEENTATLRAGPTYPTVNAEVKYNAPVEQLNFFERIIEQIGKALSGLGLKIGGSEKPVAAPSSPVVAAPANERNL